MSVFKIKNKVHFLVSELYTYIKMHGGTIKKTLLHEIKRISSITPTET